MTALVSYSTGTVSVAASGATVTGVGTIWNDGSAKPGDIFQIGNFQSVISDVADATHLVIPPWGGGAQTGVAYKIWQVSPQRFAGAEAMTTVNRLVIALNAREIPVVVGDDETVPDPSLGEEDQTAIQPTTGKVWVMTGGVWTYLGIYRGFNLTGAYNGVTTYSIGDVMTDAGSSYVWINATPGSGHAAPNATYWQLLASKGDPGVAGPTGAGYGGTSTTSLAIGTGSKAFTTQSGLAYTNGARVRASSAANSANWMEGRATYSSTTLTINVDKIGGSGTLADWNLNVTGEPGAGDLLSANNLSDVASAATAATNLGVVRYGGSQSLTSPQQVQARSNMGIPVGHIPGDTSGSAPTTGEIGQRIQTTLSGSLGTTSAAVNCGSISLPAGVWDVSAAVIFDAKTGATTGTDWWDILSTTSTPSVSAGNAIDGVAYHDRLASVADHAGVHTHAPWRLTLASTTTVYCHAMAVFSAGTGFNVSGTLGATRVS